MRRLLPRLIVPALFALLAGGCVPPPPSPSVDAGDVGGDGDGDGDLGDGDGDVGDGDGDGDSSDGGGVDAGPGIDPTDELFDPNRLITIEVTMAPEDWDSLRTEARSLLHILRPGCTAEPFPSVFNWYPAEVSLDGELVTEIAVRKKGFFGSLSETKPSLKLDFDRFVADQTYQGSSRMTLNNSRQDPSYVRQCIAYQLFEAFGVPAPRCNFASVTVNGQHLGVYAHVESIKRPYIRRHFDDDDGILYEGTLSDFRDGWLGTLEQKTNEATPDFTVPEGIQAALLVPDEQLVEALAPYLDLDEYLTFWAAEVLTSHWDGYAGNTNNYYLYVDPTDGKAHFLPWGTDGSMIPGYLFFEGLPAPTSVLASGLLARRLYRHPEVQPLYLDRIQDLLDTAFHEDAILDELNRMDELIDPGLLVTELGDQEVGLNTTRNFVENLRAAVEGEIAAGPEEWDYPLREEPCLPDLGSFAGSFATTFGTYPADDYLATGTGSLGGTVSGLALETLEHGSGAGPDENDGSRVNVIIVGTEADGSALFAFVAMDADLFAPGEVTIDDVSCQVGLYRFVPGSGIENLGLAYEGTVILDEASLTGGAAVTGSLQASVTLFQ